MKSLGIDLETFSSVDLRKAGLYKYADAEDFEILLFAWAEDFGQVQLVDLTQGEEIPARVVAALGDPSVVKHAYNAAFEWYCLQRYFVTPLEQWRCTQVHGLYCGYPPGLAAIGEALGLATDKRKLASGASLIRLFCQPQANGKRILPVQAPDKWELFKGYCRQDVVTELSVLQRLQCYELPAIEQQLWLADQACNLLGVRVDRQFVQAALELNEQVTKELLEEAVALSGLQNPRSCNQLKGWLEKKAGTKVPDLRKSTVAALLPEIGDEQAKRMLAIRQQLARTSVKKYEAIVQAVGADDRVRGLFQFYGANRTGRWAGRLVQVQNLPRQSLPALALARQLVVEKDLAQLRLLAGNLPNVLAQLLRTCFLPAEGHVLVVADYAAIEARVLAWLAGEGWRQEVFASHGKIYEASAAAMFGVPLEKICKGQPEYELRQKGKVAELALGYQGGKGALVSMGALGQGLKEDELEELVKSWRLASPQIVRLWQQLEKAAVQAVKSGRSQLVRGLVLAWEGSGEASSFLTVQLPSGRKLFYAQPQLGLNRFGRECLRYYGLEQASRKWQLLESYGGKLTENVVQAIARDCLGAALLRLHEAGYRTVMHVHDEVVVEAQAGELGNVCALMTQPLDWAPGLVLKATGFEALYYQKD